MGAVLDKLRVGFGAGLFSSRGPSQQEKAPACIVLDYSGLVHLRGVSSKYTHKYAFKACKDNKPCDPGQPEDEGDIWPLNPELPEDTPTLYLMPTLKAGGVARFGWRCGRSCVGSGGSYSKWQPVDMKRGQEHEDVIKDQQL